MCSKVWLNSNFLLIGEEQLVQSKIDQASVIFNFLVYSRARRWWWWSLKLNQNQIHSPSWCHLRTTRLTQQHFNGREEAQTNRHQDLVEIAAFGQNASSFERFRCKAALNKHFLPSHTKRVPKMEK